MIFRKVYFILVSLVLFFISASGSWAVRAGMDYTFAVYEGNNKKEVTCDFCGYSFSDGVSYFSPISIDLKDKSVKLYFGKIGEQENDRLMLNINSGKLESSKDSEFEVDYYQPVQVREGQTVSLRGTDFKLKIISVFGKGCPPGAEC